MLEIETDITITVNATGVEAGEDVSATRLTPAEYRFADNIKVFLEKLMSPQKFTLTTCL